MILAHSAGPLRRGVLSFAACRARARAMETVNLAAFALTFLLALVLAAQVLAPGVRLAVGRLPVRRCAQRAGGPADRLGGAGVLGLRRRLPARGRAQRRARCEAGSHGALAKLRKYYILTPLFVFAMLLVALANNLGVMWVAIEGTTLASVFLVTFYGKVTSLEAAWKYAIIGGVGLSMALFGTVLTYYAGHKLPGVRRPAGLELVRPGGPRRATRQDHHAPGLHPGAARLRHQGRPRADAHLEAGCLQRGAGALGRHSVVRHAELRALRADPLLHPHQPLPGRRSFRAACCFCSDCCRWASRCRSFWCRRTSGACWPITPSITPASW